MSVIFLNVDNVIQINKKVTAKYGGIHSLRDIGLLESSVNSAIHNYQYEKLDLIALSAIYLFSIIQNHPFLDGNKRTAVMSMLIFLDLNNMDINFPQKELEDIVVKIATKEMDKDNFLKWIRGFN
jgi:death-on-curing protein